MSMGKVDKSAEGTGGYVTIGGTPDGSLNNFTPAVINPDGTFKIDPIVATEETLLDVKAAIEAQVIEGLPVCTLATDYAQIQGNLQSGSVEDTHLEDGNLVIFGEVSGQGLTVDFDFVSPTIAPSHLKIVGYYHAGGDASHWCEVQAYNWDTETYDTVSTASNRMNNQLSMATYSFDLNLDHTDVAGNTKIRIVHNVTTYYNSHRLNIDYITVYYHSHGAMGLVDKTNREINPATEDTQFDSLSHYKDANLDISGTPMYFGYLDKIGNWYIKQLNLSTGVVGYIKDSVGYPSAWSSKESLTYLPFDQVF
jgi:uncharacterized protein YqkB